MTKWKIWHQRLPEWTLNCKNGAYCLKLHFLLLVLMHPMVAFNLWPSTRWRSSKIIYNPGTWPRVTCARVVLPLKVPGDSIGELETSTRPHMSFTLTSLDCWQSLMTYMSIFWLVLWDSQVFLSWLMSGCCSLAPPLRCVINLMWWSTTLSLCALKVFLWLMRLELADFIAIELVNSPLPSSKNLTVIFGVMQWDMRLNHWYVQPYNDNRDHHLSVRKLLLKHSVMVWSSFLPRDPWVAGYCFGIIRLIRGHAFLPSWRWAWWDDCLQSWSSCFGSSWHDSYSWTSRWSSRREALTVLREKLMMHIPEWALTTLG